MLKAVHVNIYGQLQDVDRIRGHTLQDVDR